METLIIDGKQVSVECGHVALLKVLSDLVGPAGLLNFVECGSIPLPVQPLKPDDLDKFSYRKEDGTVVTTKLL